MQATVSVFEILDKVKQLLRKKGCNTIRTLGRTFRSLNSFDGIKTIDRNECLVSLRENGVEISKQEFEVLFDFLNKDGKVNFEELLIGIRGKPNSRRQALIDKAFLKFDKDGTGYIESQDIKDSFNATLHPKVQRREITEEQAFQEFTQYFGGRNKDGRISREEWNEFYAAVSSSIDNDDHFVTLMKQAWRLD